MKKILHFLVFGILTASSFMAFADESTQVKKIERIQHSRNDIVYLFNSSGWGAPSCPSANFAFFRQNAASPQGGGFEELFALVLSSKFSNSDVSFQGNCHLVSPGVYYFEINYVVSF